MRKDFIHKNKCLTDRPDFACLCSFAICEADKRHDKTSFQWFSRVHHDLESRERVNKVVRAGISLMEFFIQEPMLSIFLLANALAHNNSSEVVVRLLQNKDEMLVLFKTIGALLTLTCKRETADALDQVGREAVLKEKKIPHFDFTEVDIVILTRIVHFF